MGPSNGPVFPTPPLRHNIAEQTQSLRLRTTKGPSSFTLSESSPEGAARSYDQGESECDLGGEFGSGGDGLEAAWADDASCIDVSLDLPSLPPLHEDDEGLCLSSKRKSKQSKPAIAAEIEMAALRRQVEQLQMALKKQMALNEASDVETPRSRRKRSTPRLRMQGQEMASNSSGRDRDEGRAASCVNGSTMSPSSHVSLPASGDDRFEEMARKIEQLEYMFQTASLPPLPSLPAPPHPLPLLPRQYRMSTASSSAASALAPPSSVFNSTYASSHADAPSTRRTSIDSRYTRENSIAPSTQSFLDHHKAAARYASDEEAPMPADGTDPRSRVPSANLTREPSPVGTASTLSAYRLNATVAGAQEAASWQLPFDKEPAGPSTGGGHKLRRVRSTITIRSSSGSSGSSGEGIKGAQNTVARLLRYGTGIASPDDGPDTMRVSWSRKRTERIEKPDVKLKSAAGRGRVTVAPTTKGGKATSASATSSSCSPTVAASDTATIASSAASIATRGSNGTPNTISSPPGLYRTDTAGNDTGSMMTMSSSNCSMGTGSSSHSTASPALPSAQSQSQSQSQSPPPVPLGMPLVRLSFSHKRAERVEKPKAKMKAAGRGRVVVATPKTKKASASSSTAAGTAAAAPPKSKF